MIVRVYTDGSFHSEAQRSAWAVHAIGTLAGREHVVERRGPCPRYVLTPTHAELAAILAAVVTVKTRFPGVTRAHVYTDSLDSVELLMERRRAHDVEGPLAQKIKAEGLDMDLTWIPSHQHGSSSEHAKSNNRVDYLAKFALGELLTAEGIDLPRRRDVITALSPPTLADAHNEIRTRLARRFGGNGRGLNEGRAWAWTQLGLKPTRRARVHHLTGEQTAVILGLLRATT